MTTNPYFDQWNEFTAHSLQAMNQLSSHYLKRTFQHVNAIAEEYLESWTHTLREVSNVKKYEEFASVATAIATQNATTAQNILDLNVGFTQELGDLYKQGLCTKKSPCGMRASDSKK